MKYILLIVTIVMSLQASYSDAKSAYERGEYKQAIAEAKSSVDEYNNPELHLLWAKSAQKLGDTKAAMAAYERVVMLDEDNVEAKLALMKLYSTDNHKELSKSLYRSLQNYQLTPSQRNSLAQLQQGSTATVKSKGDIAIGYDSNINISATGSILDDYYGTIGHTGEKATLFGRAKGSVSYIDELDENGGWYLRGDGNVFYQNNIDASFYNMFVGGIKLGIGYSGNNYTISLPVSYNYIHYLDKSLLTQVQVAPTLHFTWSNNLIGAASVKYSKRDYEDQYKGMSDSSYGGSLGLYYLFSKNYLYGEFSYEDFQATEKNLAFAFIDKTMMTGSFGINYNMSSWLVARLDYRFRYGSYVHDAKPVDPNINEKRVDKYNQIELKLSHFFAKHYEIYISERYAKNNSNYIPAQYSKNIAMFGLSVNY